MFGKLIIFVGIPGSGKTTAAKNYVQQANANGEIVINLDRDMFRISAGFTVEPTKQYEEIVTQQQRAVMKHAFRNNWEVIESSTNLNQKKLNELAKFANNQGACVEIKYFDTPLEKCIENDLKRQATGGHSVGSIVIERFYAAIRKNGWPVLPKFASISDIVKYEPISTNPKAILVDIDGTVAQMDGRSPYDYTQVRTDLPIKWVIDLVQLFWTKGFFIVFMSGRKALCYTDTMDWLVANIPVEFKLYTRSADDNRPDYIVKLELFDRYIRNKYNVVFCIDDRRQVIDAYRDIGLNVLDVAGHNF